MQTRQLGFSDLHVSTVGLGTWAMGGGDWEYGWGQQADQESIDTIHRAIDLGINWLDTAAAYGLGYSEELISKAIAGRRDKILIATKCSLVWDAQRKIHGVLKAESVRKEVEDSLRRLNIDVIDLYQIHWPNPDADIEEGWGVIADLIKAGKVRYGGVSNFSVAQLERVQAIHPVASLQPQYNMLQRDIEGELLDFCTTNKIGVIAYSPLKSGVLTDKFGPERLTKLDANDWRRRDENFQEPKFSINVAFVAKLREIAARFDCSVAQLAIAWVIARQGVTSAIVGARRPSQIERSAPAGDWDLDSATVAEIGTLLAEREAQIAAIDASV